MSESTQGQPPYSLAEEIANSLSHGLGAFFGVVALVLLVTEALALGGASLVASVSIYGASMVVLFLASTLYHAIPHTGAKRWLKMFDHCAIYLLIAGTYTPFLLVTLDNAKGVTFLVIVWSLALLGLLFKLVFGHRYRKLSLVTYLGMGWISLFVIGELMARLPAGGFWLLAGGGLLYSLGVIFYVWQRLPFNHAIWHLFVLGGCVCHFLAIYGYVVPISYVSA